MDGRMDGRTDGQIDKLKAGGKKKDGRKGKRNGEGKEMKTKERG